MCAAVWTRREREAVKSTKCILDRLSDPIWHKKCAVYNWAQPSTLDCHLDIDLITTPRTPYSLKIGGCCHLPNFEAIAQ